MLPLTLAPEVYKRDGEEEKTVYIISGSSLPPCGDPGVTLNYTAGKVTSSITIYSSTQREILDAREVPTHGVEARSLIPWELPASIEAKAASASYVELPIQPCAKDICWGWKEKPEG